MTRLDTLVRELTVNPPPIEDQARRIQSLLAGVISDRYQDLDAVDLARLSEAHRLAAALVMAAHTSGGM